ncbi:MAG: serine/threonine-protein phosphatase [Lachnospiraceae bacterium]|nr:serine/threonine-protein phosphatase [Lachnospiraceae bacterium]
MDIKWVSFTDTGLQRKVNEDSIYSFKKDNCAVFIVADGMGGYENGKNASDTIVRYVAKYIELDMDKIIAAKKQFDKVYDQNTFFEDIKNVLLSANKEIFENYTAKGHSSGSTLIMLAIYQNVYNIFWAGDSHIYQVIDDDLVALIVDDVWENNKDAIKDLTKEQIVNDKNYGRLTNAFGTIENVNIHMMNGFIKSGMKLLLCSDGVYKYCDKKVLRELIINKRKNEDIEDKDKTVSANSKNDELIINNNNENEDDKEDNNMQNLSQKIKEEIYKNGAIDNLSFIYVEIN